MPRTARARISFRDEAGMLRTGVFQFAVADVVVACDCCGRRVPAGDAHWANAEGQRFCTDHKVQLLDAGRPAPRDPREQWRDIEEIPE